MTSLRQSLTENTFFTNNKYNLKQIQQKKCSFRQLEHTVLKIQSQQLTVNDLYNINFWVAHYRMVKAD